MLDKYHKHLRIKLEYYINLQGDGNNLAPIPETNDSMETEEEMSESGKTKLLLKKFWCKYCR